MFWISYENMPEVAVLLDYPGLAHTQKQKKAVFLRI